MFGNNLVFWCCCALLLVASSSKHLRNFTNNNKKHDISKLQYKIDETSIKDCDNEKKRNISTIKFNVTDCNKDSNECFVPHVICKDNYCDVACCHLEDHLTESILGENNKYFQAFLDMQYSLQSKIQEINLTAFNFYYDPCRKLFNTIEFADNNKNVLIANAEICYFIFLAVSFWLSVMSFDMWWTFRDISSLLQTNVRNSQQERERKKKDRKKLIMYSVYAWGISFILTIVCVIMESVPYPIYSSLRPEFGIFIFLLYFNNEYTKIGLYYWIPSTICSISSICLFISTALKIRCYEKNTTHHLRNVDSRVYDENKECAYLTDMVQNIGIFIIFVCKKRVMKLLLTRFGYQNYNVPPRARQIEVFTDSNTRIIRSRMTRLRERINLWQKIRRRNNMHDETAM